MALNLRELLNKLFHPRKQVILPDHNEEESELLFKFEKGKRLSDTVRSAGWKDVTEILEDTVFQRVYALLNEASSDKDKIALMQKEAHAAAVLYDQLLTQVREAILESEKIPAIVATKVTARSNVVDAQWS